MRLFINFRWFRLFTVTALAFILVACSGEQQVSYFNQRIVATSISPLADLIKQVGGEKVQVISLVPTGSDPHTYEPTPDAVRHLSTASIFFANGVGQEYYLEKLVENSQNPELRTVILADGLELLGSQDESPNHEEAAHLEKDPHFTGDGHNHSNGNPHLWLSVKNTQAYVEKIRDTLIEMYPEDKETFTANAKKYLQELEALDQWIQEQINLIPEENRNIIVYHDAWTYYTDRYGLSVVRPIVYAEESEPSAKDYAQLLELIKKNNIKAIFGEVGFNTKLVQHLATEAGVKIVGDLYNDTLGNTPETDSYIDIMKHNTNAFVTALK